MIGYWDGDPRYFTWKITGEVLGMKKVIGQVNTCRNPDEVRRAFAAKWPDFIIERIEPHTGGVIEANKILSWSKSEEEKRGVPTVKDAFEKLVDPAKPVKVWTPPKLAYAL